MKHMIQRSFYEKKLRIQTTKRKDMLVTTQRNRLFGNVHNESNQLHTIYSNTMRLRIYAIWSEYTYYTH